MEITFSGNDAKELLNIIEPETDDDSEIYLCNPLKNNTCNKRGCRWYGKGECYCTFNRDYRALPNEAKKLKALYESQNRNYETALSIFMYFNKYKDLINEAESESAKE